MERHHVCACVFNHVVRCLRIKSTHVALDRMDSADTGCGGASWWYRGRRHVGLHHVHHVHLLFRAAANRYRVVIGEL